MNLLWKEKINEIEGIFGEQLTGEDKLMLDNFLDVFWDRSKDITTITIKILLKKKIKINNVDKKDKLFEYEQGKQYALSKINEL